MTTILISPAERPPITNLGQTSSLCEKVGSDILFETDHGLFGVQRKEQCLAPETRVLTQDLRWVPLYEVSVGDWLLGFDENVPGPRKRRCWKPTQVVAATPVRLPSFLLTFDDGTKVVASGEHRWLTYHGNGTNWIQTEKLQPQSIFPTRASRLVKLADVWNESRDWGAGYLAAAWDGEGHLQQRPSVGNGHAVQLSYTQTTNAMLEQVEVLLDSFGFSYLKSKAPRSKEHWKVCYTIRVAPRAEALRFLGQIRPLRILQQFNPERIGQVYSKPRPMSVRLVTREPIGEANLIGLTTTTGTFVAEGIASHNSDLVASVRDGRLGRELEQMATLVRGFLVVEGTPAWDREGNLQSQHTRWTMKQQNGVLLAVQSKGVMVLHSRNPLETCAVVEHLIEWCSKSEHVSSLIARDKPQTHWGKLDDRTTAIHIWSGLPSVGPERAARIYDAGLRLFKCGVTVEELVSVDGIGKKTANAILDCIADKPVAVQEGRS